MPIGLTLDDGPDTAQVPLDALRRVLVEQPMSVADLQRDITLRNSFVIDDGRPAKVMHLDLDYIYDPDPVQQEKNLGHWLDRIIAMGVNFGILALLLIVMTVVLASMGIVREKELGTLEQLNVTPLRRWQLIVGKLLPYGLIGIIDIFLVVAVAVWWFRVPLLGSFWLLFALTLATGWTRSEPVLASTPVEAGGQPVTAPLLADPRSESAPSVDAAWLAALHEQREDLHAAAAGPSEAKPAPKAPAKTSIPSAVFVPQAAMPNQTITDKLQGFPSGKHVVIYRQGRDLPFLELDTGSKGEGEQSFINPIQRSGTYAFDARIVRTKTAWAPSETLKLTSAAVLQSIFMALLGTALSIVLALPLSFFAARNLMKGSRFGWAAYSTTRLGFNVVRSFEVLVIAVVLVQIVGPGPFAGVLALAIHGIGAIGKLYSEAIESIDRGPLEAITATGASRLQVVIFGVVPQIIPQFVAFTMYRWDINVRMATVIGLVGGGGVGQLLTQYIGLTQWSRAATAIWLIAAVVMLMDYVSAVIREKLV
jgi:phosphonate ABC transporter permease subunit PhnE